MAGPATVVAGERTFATVTAVTGELTLEGPALRLAPRAVLRPADRVSTAAGAAAQILLEGMALVTLRESSDVSFAREAHRVIVNVHAGRVGVVLAPGRIAPGEVVEIRTPAGTATLRGTSVVTETSSTGASTFYVKSGAVDVLGVGSEAPTRVVGGNALDVVAGQPEAKRPIPVQLAQQTEGDPVRPRRPAILGIDPGALLIAELEKDLVVAGVVFQGSFVGGAGETPLRAPLLPGNESRLGRFVSQTDTIQAPAPVRPAPDCAPNAKPCTCPR